LFLLLIDFSFIKLQPSICSMPSRSSCTMSSLVKIFLVIVYQIQPTTAVIPIQAQILRYIYFLFFFLVLFKAAEHTCSGFDRGPNLGDTRVRQCEDVGLALGPDRDDSILPHCLLSAPSLCQQREALKEQFRQLQPALYNSFVFTFLRNIS